MEVSGQLHALAALPPRDKAPGTHWIGGWLGSRAVLDAVVKRKIPSPRPESNPRTSIIQPVAQRYEKILLHCPCWDWTPVNTFSSMTDFPRGSIYSVLELYQTLFSNTKMWFI
jgi:hypothetical protein